jgi:hypothetical protein
MAKPKRSLSYEEIMRTGLPEMERLAEANLIDDATRMRCVHIGRFFERVGSMIPSDMVVQDIFSEEDLQRLWTETADPSELPDRIGRHPLLH